MSAQDKMSLATKKQSLMTYKEALVATNHSVPKMWQKRLFLPYKKRIVKIFPMPTDKKRQVQFLELYRHYNEDWNKAAAHFQLEEFEPTAVMEGCTQSHPFLPLLTSNKIHINFAYEEKYLL